MVVQKNYLVKLAALVAVDGVSGNRGRLLDGRVGGKVLELQHRVYFAVAEISDGLLPACDNMHGSPVRLLLLS